MKSILQLDRETQLDRQRRYLFCWCYRWACEKNTVECSDWGIYISRMLENAVEQFAARCTSKLIVVRKVPFQLYLSVLLWAIHAGEFPEELKAVPPTHFICKNDFLSCCEQRNAIAHAYQEVKRHCRFRADNVDNDFSAEEQAAAQGKLRQLSTLPHGL